MNGKCKLLKIIVNEDSIYKGKSGVLPEIKTMLDG